jgi:hypothetical protein
MISHAKFDRALKAAFGFDNSGKCLNLLITLCA